MENTIFIKNLHKEIGVAELCDEFRVYGKILSANIVYDNDMKSVGEAFISFQDVESALTAAKWKYRTNVLGYSIHVCLSVEKEKYKKVFVKNFSRKWDLGDLYKEFGSIGCIKKAEISEDDHGKSNGYGYIKFETHASAQKAVESMNGKVYDGQHLIVERFKRKSERENLQRYSLKYAEEMLKKSTQRDNLHVKNLPKSMTEIELRELFSKSGEISSVKIIYDDNGSSRGFGFVSFKSAEDAEKARRRLNGYTLNGKNIIVSFKQDGNARKHCMNLKKKDKEVQIKEYKYRSQSVSSLQFLPHPLNFSRFKKKHLTET